MHEITMPDNGFKTPEKWTRVIRWAKNSSEELPLQTSKLQPLTANLDFKVSTGLALIALPLLSTPLPSQVSGIISYRNGLTSNISA